MTTKLRSSRNRPFWDKARMMRGSPPLATLVLVCLARAAVASDGIVEINRTCAVQTGCFPGDSAGYPVTITGIAGRSYRLTSDLFISGQNTTGIEISANEISIDLAGFRISCSNFVPPSTVQPCSTTGGGTGSGIEVDDPSMRSAVEVRNGSVIGVAFDGVRLGNQGVVRGLRVSQIGQNGISCLAGCVIDGNTAYQCGNHGIFATTGSIVSGNTTTQNDTAGILALDGSTVSGNTAFENSGRGIVVTASTVSSNAAYENGNDGILAFTGSTVSGNTASQNNGRGIVAIASIVSGNTVANNSGAGLSLDSDTGYRENVIVETSGTLVTGGVDLGGNLCNGATTCP